MTDQVLIDAIAYALSREVVPSEDYYGNMTDVQRRRAVSIAGMAEVDQIRYIMSQVNSALINGQSFEQFKQNVNLVDIELPEHRLSLIYHQNIQQAYAYGRYVEQVRNQDNKPYLMYKSKNDSRVRPWHQVLNGTIRPIGDAFWINNCPPLSWNCRCVRVGLTIAEAESLGITKAIDLKYVIPEKGFGKLPIHFDDTLEQLLQDKITSAAIENHKQSGIIAKIGGRIKETAVKILSSPAASLSSLIAKAKEKLSNEK